MEIDILLRNGLIITMNKERQIIANGSVAINGSEIIDLGEVNELDNKYEAKKIIDCTNKVITPGFINLHTHAPMSLLRGYANDKPLNEWLHTYMIPTEKDFVDEKFCYYGTMLACIEMIESGITCFADMYYFEREIARAAFDIGMRGVLGETIMIYATPDSDDFDRGLQYTEDFINEWKGNELITPAVGPHAPNTCNDEILKRSKAMADKYGVPLLIHLSETKDEVSVIQSGHGCRPVEYLNLLNVLDKNVVAAHCVWLSSNDMELLEMKNVKVAHNPTSNLKLGSGIAPIPELLHHGIMIGIGTDGCASNNDLDYIEEMRLAALIHKGTHTDPTNTSALRIIEMGTIKGAKALSLDQKVGSIEVSKKADLTIIDLDKTHLIPFYDIPIENIYSHLIYTAKSSDIESVLINGRLVMENRQILTVKKQEILDECKAITKKINEHKRKQEPLFTKLIRMGMVNLYPSYETQLKLEPELDKISQIENILLSNEILIKESTNLRQHDTYLVNKENEPLRLREEQVLSSEGEVQDKPVYTLMYTEESKIKEKDGLILLRRRKIVDQGETIALFDKKKYDVEIESELTKTRHKIVCVYDKIDFTINIDRFEKPVADKIYVELKTSEWTEMKAMEHIEVMSRLVRLLGLENEKQIHETYREIIRKLLWT